MPWWGEGQSAEQGTDQNTGQPLSLQPQDLGRTLRLKVPAHSVALRDLCSRKIDLASENPLEGLGRRMANQSPKDWSEQKPSP